MTGLAWPWLLSLFVAGVAAGLVAAAIARRQRLRPLGLPYLPEDSMVTARAFGGHAVIVTPFHVVVYASELARTLPIMTEGVLTHPSLADLADEAWAAGETITRPFDHAGLGSLLHIVAQAAVIDSRWILLTIDDRTDHVHTEEIRRDFISNLGHEMRTPITSVALIAQTLLAVFDDAEQVQHFAARLGETAVRLETLTEDMIALALVQDGGSLERFGQVQIDDAVAQAHKRQLTSAETAGIELRWSKRTPALVWGDAEALATAVENLISNAINYSPPGSRVTLTTRVDESEAMVTISVIDRGIGIESAEQDRVFERFYRTDAARNTRTGGTGLGLAIVKNTALAHGGLVAVASRVGAGSTFTFSLPLMRGGPLEFGQVGGGKPTLRHTIANRKESDA